MRVYVAEKKEVGKALADALGGRLQGHYFDCGDDRITWLWGHLLTLTDPEDHGHEKAWRLDKLPIEWPIDYKPIERHKEHLEKVMGLLREADEIVNAGDPDPEGQRLVDEVLEYAKVTHKPVKRVLINDNNTSAILKAIDNMQDNQAFFGLSQAALARAVCDQRFGYNLTRLYTKLGENKGHNGVLSVGRVQTPILGLVVRRDRANKSHEKQAYFVITADIAIDEFKVKSRYRVKPDDPVDDKKRIVDEAFAKGIVEDVLNQNAVVSLAKTEEKQRQPPLPYDLLSLQADAAGMWKYSPKKTLEITQSLRDQHKAITYNRSDCRFLNDERHEEAGELLPLLSAINPQAKQADSGLKSKAFNSKQVTAHHAIIPTLSVPDLANLSDEESNIYQLIVKQYIAQFYLPERFEMTTLIFDIDKHQFDVKGRVDLDPGWTVLFKQTDKEKEENEKINLQSLQVDDKGDVTDARFVKQFTKPLPLYTMKALLKDLTHVAKYVTDPTVKALLKDKDKGNQGEQGGIGTPATRDSHIETLFKREYITESGKSIVSTDLGQQFYDVLPDYVVQPDLTALWHEKQKDIEAGELDSATFIEAVSGSIADEVERAKREGLAISVKDAVICPECEKGVMNRRKGKNGFFWGCNRYPDCKTTRPDKNGKPELDQPKKSAVEVSDEHPCPECGKGLVRRPSKKDKKVFWWGCSGFPSCKFTTFDTNGKPKPK